MQQPEGESRERARRAGRPGRPAVEWSEVIRDFPQVMLKKARVDTGSPGPCQPL